MEKEYVVEVVITRTVKANNQEEAMTKGRIEIVEDLENYEIPDEGVVRVSEVE